MAKEVYSVSEAAKILHVSGATLRKYINDGKVKATRYFGKWIIPRSEVERYRAQLREIGIDTEDLK
jgi:excisionase family DNA binding protein